MAEHYLDGTITQPFWDNSVEPRLEIESGDVVVFDTPEPCGQVTPDWTHEDMANISFDPIHALVGSVFVKDARPGDALQVDLLDFKHKGWAWSGHLKGFGLLAEDFDFAYIHHWELAGDRCLFGVNDIALPFRPFCGTMGVAPAQPGRSTTIAPSYHGGNLDIRDLTIGSTVWLPVQTEGALFACGDCHSAQGDGEICGTGVETPMEVTLRLTVCKDMPIRELQFRAEGPLGYGDAEGYHATTAHGPDLMENAKNAARYMIDWLVDNYGVNRSQAYILCSTAGDLKISQVVDAPNWIVSMYFPLSVLHA